MLIVMLIREATIDDLESVAEYGLRIVRQHQAYNLMRFVQLPNHEQQVEDAIHDAIQSPRATVLVVEKGNTTVVGFAFIKMEPMNLEDITDEAAWLHDIYLDAEVRGGGWGKRLLDASVEAAKKLGSHKLMLHVATQNTFAQELFRAYGFAPTMLEMMLHWGDSSANDDRCIE